VANGGPLIGPDVLATLTQPFQRGTTIGGGRGLGLAIVDSIMQQVGGTLQLSSPREGDTSGFEARLTFPRLDPSLTEPALEPARLTWLPQVVETV
jgi:two-component system OmpR family sensor kinase